MDKREAAREAAQGLLIKANREYFAKLTDPDGLSEDERVALGWAHSFGFDAGFNAGFDAGYNARGEDGPVRSWLPINRENTSLRWILLLDRIDGTGRQGLRLGRPEDTGWRLIDEYGRST